MTIEPSLALQKLIYARLVASADLAELVPPANILDRNGRPEVFPCVLLGAGHATFADDYERFYEEVHADIHVWAREAGTTEVKAISGAVREAIRDRPWLALGYRCHGIIVERATYMRDPAGEHAHGVVTVRAIMQRVAA